REVVAIDRRKAAGLVREPTEAVLGVPQLLVEAACPDAGDVARIDGGAAGVARRGRTSVLVGKRTHADRVVSGRRQTAGIDRVDADVRAGGGRDRVLDVVDDRGGGALRRVDAADDVGQV